LSPLGVPQQLRHFGRADDHTFAYIPMPNPNLPVRTGDNVLAKLSTGLVARYSLVERAAGRPQLLGTLLQCCEWWYALGVSVQISIAIGENVATGRAIAAARVLLGLDQAALAMLASVSPATTSNVERGHGVRDDTLHSILSAVRRRGATVSIDRNGFASIAIYFHEPPQRAPRSPTWQRLSFERPTLL